MSPRRRSAEEVHHGVASGRMWLVCVYPKESYERSHLEGAISMDELAARLPGMKRDAEIIFY